ncbi:MAG TPA: hypothetical protein ENK62_02670, partial [Chromatiales bacterium]|nr:hypothetical protein [Chromatiales bacterium]
MRTSELARRLKPFIVQWLQEGSVAVSGGGGGGLTVHALDGAYHSGTLADSQAPQFLKTDGSRNLTGNLAVDPGVTIDGVDISAHAASASAHHSAFVGLEDDAGTAVSPAADYRIQVLGGDGLDSTAGTNVLTLAVDSTVVRTSRQVVAGDGLTGGGALSGDVTLNVGAGDGILANANDVAVDEGFAFNWTAQHSFGAGLISNGDAILNQDLYVGGSTPSTTVLFVDESQGSVGIMSGNLPGGVPDPQFALDVGGPARAEYWIGPHALQLDDAEMIVHFDGPRPFETDFSGTAMGHMGQVATESGGVIYRPGKFGKAIQVAEATTNVLSNPSFEISGYWSTSDTLTYETNGFIGSYCGKVTYASGSATTIYQDYSVSGASGDPWTGSAYVWAEGNNVGKSVAVIVYTYESGTWVNSSTTVTLTSTPQRVVVTHTATGTYTTVRFRVQMNDTTSGAFFFVDACQLEQKGYATPYCDGSLGPGHSWSGTAHASTSTRTVAGLSWTWPSLSTDTPWTIAFWAKDECREW